MKIALAQTHLTIGDFDNNKTNVINQIKLAINAHAHLVIFPEQTITVYGANDLLYSQEYYEQSSKILDEIIPYSEQITILIGTVQKLDKDFYNSALLIENRKITTISSEENLSYEKQRYFKPQSTKQIFEQDGIKFLTLLGDDEYKEEKADWVIKLSSTPFIKNRETKPINGKKTIFLNHLGLAQHSIFDGGSFAANENGKILAYAKRLTQELVIIDTSASEILIKLQISIEEEIFNSLSFAFKEFCRINKFEKAVIGLSGGIDSALTAVIMCNAIGPQNVLGITMPSKYSTEGSWNDSYALAKNLNMECKTVPIKPLFDTFINEIQGKSYCDLAEENLQARLRANILMSYSNRENRILVSTGNKSEAAMGYCTLYGDTCGGINLIADLYKQEVYAISRWINKDKEVIPTNIITKAPSAELRPNQKDQDTLPDYEILDEILFRYIECGESIEKISEKFDKNLVKDIIRKLNIMEFKRNQITYKLKISKKSLLDRNIPLTTMFKG